MGSRKGLVATVKRKRKKKAEPPPIEKPEKPVNELYQELKKVRCPWCDSSRVFQNSGSRSGIIYYRCGRCVDGETGDWTTFKVWLAE